MRKMSYLTLAAGLVLVAVSNAFAAAAPAPEINPGSVSAGLALLAGGVLLVRAWRK